MTCSPSGTIRRSAGGGAVAQRGVGVHNERRRSILVWGPAGSGKSLYLASLVMWLTRARDESPLAVIPADDATALWITRRSAPHPDGVALTAPEPPAQPPLFRIYSLAGAAAPARRSRCLAELAASDAAAGDRSSSRLDDALGVILLLPVESMMARADVRAACVTWLTTTLARLPETGDAPPAVSMPVAVCLTQTDAAPDAVRRDATQWLESFGTESIRALRAHCARYEVFKVSSLGRTPRRRDGADVVVGGPEPRGVVAPIRWILRQNEAGAEAAA
jgi:hypothetical protein